ncbi:hypothetical protein MU582_04730 [Nocardioidaceae bacterium SCSIO 66511]|nr:hypothetical protein MU582_04730 [Nocardioidaceae bacterium SCSIO 66511]
MDETTPHPMPDDIPAILTPLDLHTCWTMLMGELGFAERKLWIIFIEPDGLVVPHIVQIADLPAYPSAPNLDSLMELCARQLEYLRDDGIAMLLSRPGPDVLTDSDRGWAAGIATTAREHGVRVYPTHLANDEAVRVFAPDDLIGAA